MSDCPECETRDSMYETASGKEKCWKCGHTRKRESRTSQRPNRPPGAGCGTVLTVNDEGETEEVCLIGMNDDLSACDGKPRGMKKHNDDEYMVVCSRHRD